MLLVDETAPVMNFEGLYWTKSIFSFVVGLAYAQIGAAYSKKGATMEVYVVRRDLGFDLQEALQSLLRMLGFFSGLLEI